MFGGLSMLFCFEGRDALHPTIIELKNISHCYFLLLTGFVKSRLSVMGSSSVAQNSGKCLFPSVVSRIFSFPITEQEVKSLFRESCKLTRLDGDTGNHKYFHEG